MYENGPEKQEEVLWNLKLLVFGQAYNNISGYTDTEHVKIVAVVIRHKIYLRIQGQKFTFSPAKKWQQSGYNKWKIREHGYTFYMCVCEYAFGY